ncbi:hypothetical protein SAMN04488057_10110 [Cyclobacterium lianum]|uniref:Outer membrane protein beta-barrel domain-containing protein n=1 Tax=Cyclobacterium lianum TaxID=388280 RepID=A0A1M7HQ59_9BACT|nr:hypothetical protein [Cyclobacterium lianum]SHM30549.1 hypothetical protein SAMN04488057_10110 [Cyclobacterium lianum]
MMNFKSTILFLLLIGLGHFSKAQGLESRIGLGSFALNRDYGYERPARGWNFSVGFTYDWRPDWAMGTVYNRSFNTYFRESVAETPLLNGSLPTRSELISDHFSFLIGRKFPLPLYLRGQIGLGLGLAIDENRFYQPIFFDEDRGAYRGFNLVEQYQIGLIFPAQISIRKNLGDRWRLGLEAGLFMDDRLRVRSSFWGPAIHFSF